MAKLPIEAVADASQAKQELDSLGTEGGASLDKMQIAGVALGTLLAGAVTKGLELVKDAITGVIQAGTEWVELSNIQEDAERALDGALRATGQFLPELSAEYKALASEFQNLTAIGDEELLPQMGRLITVGGVQRDQMKESTQAALDLAAGLGVSANTSFMLLARAATGSTETLTRYGITLEKTGDAQQDFNNLLELVANRFGGLAAEKAETFSGKLQAISNRVGDAKEKLGEMVKDGLEPLLKTVTETVIPKLEKFVEKLDPDAVDAIKGIGVALSDQLEAFDNFLGKMDIDPVDKFAKALKAVEVTIRSIGNIIGATIEQFSSWMGVAEAASDFTGVFNRIVSQSIDLAAAQTVASGALNQKKKDEKDTTEELTQAERDRLAVLKFSEEQWELENERVKKAAEEKAKAAEETKKLAATEREAGTAAGAMGQAVEAASKQAAAAIQVMTVTASNRLQELHQAAVEKVREIEVIQGTVIQRQIGQTGEQVEIGGGLQRRLLGRLQRIIEATPGFFQGSVRNIAEAIQGGRVDLGALQQMFDALAQTQAGVQTAQNRGDITGNTAGELRAVLQSLGQVLGIIQREGVRANVDGPGLAGELRNLLERGEARA